MTWYEGILLGLLQGATEFLPVSSSGHLVMGQTLLGVEVPGAGIEVALHLATLLSILIVYRSRVWALICGVLRGDSKQLRYGGLLVLASIPAAIAGVGFGDFFESLFDRPAVTAVALIVTGCVVWTARRALARGPDMTIGVGSALVLGFAQAAAIVPGISRSGATVVAGLWHGVRPSEAAAFSFLMSVPAVGGAAILKLPDLMAAGGTGIGVTTVTLPVLLLAAAAACGIGVAAIRLFRAMLAKQSFHVFAPYLWLVGAAFLWLTLP